MKPWSGLAAMMLLLALALYVVSMASSMWLINATAGQQRQMGPFEFCANDWKSNVHECHSVDNSCTAMFSEPVGAQYSGSDCVKTRVVRAFLIMALVFTGMAFVATWLGYNSYDDIIYRAAAVPLSLLGMICGLIAWAVWTGMAQQDFSSDWRYSWAYGLSLGAWLLNIAAAIACVIPSPVRDKAMLESSQARGVWRDMFTTAWWTRGADLGGRHDERPGMTGGPLGSTGTTYETRSGGAGAPLGTGYRSGETRKLESPRATTGTYGYGESEAERERLHRERAGTSSYGSGGYSGETETERLNRLERERAGGEKGAAKTWLGSLTSSALSHDTAPSTTSSRYTTSAV